MPMGKATDEWVFGNVEEGFKKADLVLDETFMTQSTGHQPLETRTAMAYWQNGKLHLHGSTQSTVQTVASVARWTGITPDKVVIISEYTGGGFGSKIPGAISMAIPALLSKKANAPVMMRITREEEHFIGRARPGIIARVKIGFRKDGRITAIDMYTVQDNGPYDAQGDFRSAGNTVSLAYQPETMRWRGVTVLTNTPPKTSQRAPGGMQGIGIVEPIISKAAKKLGLDQVEVRKINAPAGKAPFGPALPNGKQAYVTSAFVREALDKGRELFQWEAKKTALTAKRASGPKRRGIGVAVSPYAGGSIGFDGLFLIKPDGRLQFQSGIGNLGTHSVIDVHRQAAEMLGVPWEQCDVVFGNTAKNLPWTCVSAGSQTAHAMTRAAHAAATDAIKKLQEIAAKARGGKPEAYTVANGRVSGPGGGMTFAQAAEKAIEFGGKFDGHELPADINAFTKTSATALVGQGLMAVAKDAYPRDGQHAVLRRRLRGSRSGHRDRRLPRGELHGDRRRRHRPEPAQPGRPAVRRIDARPRPRHQPEVGLRPAVRRGAGAAVPSQQAADDSRRAEELLVGRGQSARSGNADGHPRRRRAAGRRGLRRDHERAPGCARGRSVPAFAGDPRHAPDGDRERRKPNTRTTDVSHLRLQISDFRFQTESALRGMLWR